MRKPASRLPAGWTPERGTIRTNKAREHEPVTIERLERALLFCARLVEADGPILIPLFESLERDLAAMRAEQDAVGRAKRLMDSYKDRMPSAANGNPHGERQL
jgi:hypothetical protein